jgi:hypothetical protein
LLLEFNPGDEHLQWVGRDYQNRVRQNADFSSRFKLILAVQSALKKYSA